MTARPFSLYVHIPFCAQKCPYCDFNTYATVRAPEHAYVESLTRELERYANSDDFRDRQIATIFFGGGTPSILSATAVAKLLDSVRDLFECQEGAEISLEANPSGISVEKLAGYRAAGINRLSFGIQSFSAARLKLLGRDHTVNDASNAITLARQVGFDNVSLDLIYGVPGQSMEDLRSDILIATTLPIDHLSAYALTIEQGTPFYQRQQRGLLTMPPDDLVAEMMDEMPTLMSSYGFHRYEISNYAKCGKESRHNMAYWIGADYLGLGAGAHSCLVRYEGDRRVAALRWCNLAQPEAYMQGIGAEGIVSWRDRLTPEDLMFEFFYLGLRLTRGVSSELFHTLFGIPVSEQFGSVLDELSAEGFISVEDGVFRLTPLGIRLSDSVSERFITGTGLKNIFCSG